MPLYRDQTGYIANIAEFPSRIVSLVPSQTELLADLGLEERVSGITKFCVHPAHWFRTKKRVGGTKKPDFELIRQLNPDLILANREENTREHIEALRALYPVWTSDISHLSAALEMVKEVGMITSTPDKSAQLSKQIQQSFQSLPSFPSLRACYLIWKEPYMTVGGDTFIHDMMRRCGLENVFSEKTRYPEVSAEEIISRKPEIVLLSSEPFPFSDRHVEQWNYEWTKVPACLADGELFSWYGSRLLKSPPYFYELRRAIEALI